MSYEKRSQVLLSQGRFLIRLLKHVAVALGLVLISIALGAAGYHYLEGLGWIDSIYNATMILTGMGPVSPLYRDVSKIFASCYAVFGGIVILAITGIVLAPLAHRLLHLFHLKENE